MAYDKNSMGEALDWNDEISDEGGEFPILEAGDYNFTVESFTRKRFNGSDKMCACNQVVLKLRIDGEGVTVEDNLFLNKKTEWKVSQFFLAIGQKQPGVPLRPNWDALPGSRGRCKLYVDKWKSNKDGREFESNKVEKYYPAGSAPTQQAAPAQQYQQAAPAPQQQTYQAPAQQSYQPQQQTVGGWTAGKF